MQRTRAPALMGLVLHAGRCGPCLCASPGGRVPAPDATDYIPQRPSCLGVHAGNVLCVRVPEVIRNTGFSFFF